MVNKQVVKVALCGVLCTGSAFAQDSGNLSHSSNLNHSDSLNFVNSPWSFGLQAAPAVFGLSLRYQASDTWQVQGILQPSGDDAAIGARLLRKSTQKEFWHSYLFAGLAVTQDSSFNSFDFADREYTEGVFTTGLGVEWAWRAKNPSHPPLSWSLELGLGYSNRSFDDNAFDDDSEVFLAAGAGIHYQFE